MNAQDKIRVAIHNLLETEKQMTSLNEAYQKSLKLGQHHFSEVGRVIRATLGEDKAAKGVVFAGERFWLEKGVLQREEFTAEVL